MPWSKFSTPKFGNWDKNEDLSYSIVFDKMRAEKEASSQVPDEDENALSGRSLSPKVVARAGNKAFQNVSPFSVKGRKEMILEKPPQNEKFPLSHQRGTSKDTVENGTFHDKKYESCGPAVSSWQAAVMRNHQNLGPIACPHNLNACSQNFPCAYHRNPMVSAVASRQTGANSERHYHAQDNQSCQGKRHSKSLGSGRQSHQEELAPASRMNTDMQRESSVPKFGHWENEESFTTAFENMRKERSSKGTSRRPKMRVAQVQMEEDLYKGSARGKNRRSWLAMMCCTRPDSRVY